MPACCVPECTTGYASSRKKNLKEQKKNPSMFVLPKDPEELRLWTRRIKSDRPLTSKDVVCELHFQDIFVNRYYEHIMPDGTVHRIKRGKPELRKGAVPTIFPNRPSYMTSTIKSRKPPKERPRPPAISKSKSETSVPKAATTSPVPVVSDPLPVESNEENKVGDRLLPFTKLSLPQGWWEIEMPHQIMFINVDTYDDWIVKKRVLIEQSGQTSIFFGLVKVQIKGYETISSKESIIHLLTVLDYMEVPSTAFDRSLSQSGEVYCVSHDEPFLPTIKCQI